MRTRIRRAIKSQSNAASVMAADTPQNNTLPTHTAPLAIWTENAVLCGWMIVVDDIDAVAQAFDFRRGEGPGGVGAVQLLRDAFEFAGTRIHRSPFMQRLPHVGRIRKNG